MIHKNVNSINHTYMHKHEIQEQTHWGSIYMELNLTCYYSTSYSHQW